VPPTEINNTNMIEKYRREGTVGVRAKELKVCALYIVYLSHTHTHTHTHICLVPSWALPFLIRDMEKGIWSLARVTSCCRQEGEVRGSEERALGRAQNHNGGINPDHCASVCSFLSSVEKQRLGNFPACTERKERRCFQLMPVPEKWGLKISCSRHVFTVNSPLVMNIITTGSQGDSVMETRSSSFLEKEKKEGGKKDRLLFLWMNRRDEGRRPTSRYQLRFIRFVKDLRDTFIQYN